MGLNANNQPKSGGDFVAQEALEPALCPARVVQVIDLGLQPQQAYQGKDKPPINKVHLTYELSEEFMKDEDGKEQLDKPRWLSEDLPLHNLTADKAKSTRRYNAIDPTGSTAGEFTELVGMPCQVAVTKNPRKGKPNEFVNYIGDVSGAIAIRGYEQPALVNPPTVFVLDNPDVNVFNSLPDWLKDRIKANLEYNGSKLQALLGEQPTADAPQSQPEAPKAPSDPTAPPAPEAPPAPAVPA